MATSDIIGSAGVALILVAFAANLMGRMERTTTPYLWLNLVGGALACASSVMIGFVPFVVLEGVWAIVALGAIVRRSAGAGEPAR